MEYITWSALIRKERIANKDSSPFVSCTADQFTLNQQISCNYGGYHEEDYTFVYWSENYVYTPYDYDGFPHIRSVPRNPIIEDDEEDPIYSNPNLITFS